MQFELEAKKSLGQNFLKNTTIIKKMVDECSLIQQREHKKYNKSLHIVEIGPGTGALTAYLLELQIPVLAIETDDRAIPLLTEKFKGYTNFTLLHKDIREYSLDTAPSPYIVVANIPYYLTGYISRLFLETENQPVAMIVMVQKEVAKRVCDEKQSLLSLSARTYGEPRILMHVSRGNFVPAPNVDSSVLIIDNISKPKEFKDKNFEKRYWEIAKQAFSSKRKQLGGTVLKKLDEKQKNQASVYLTKRPEELQVSDWISITKICDTI